MCDAAAMLKLDSQNKADGGRGVGLPLGLMNASKQLVWVPFKRKILKVEDGKAVGGVLSYCHLERKGEDVGDEEEKHQPV